MARLIPEVRFEDIKYKSERDVARALMETLPSDCLVIHSYPWLRETEWRGNKQLSEGETDFLIIHPGAGGFIVLEAKGGDVRYDSERMRWYRPGSHNLPKDPFKQASDGMHHFKKLIMKDVPAARGETPFAFGYAVVFPDCDYTGPMPPGATKSILFGNGDLSRLGEKLTAALKQWGCGRPPLSREIVQKMKQAVFPEFNIFQALPRKIAQDEEVLVQLTENQSKVLQMLADWPQAMIEGVAGSGKTLLAMAQAHRYAEKGHRVLFTCYNKKLAEWLESCVPENLRQNIMIRHFHGLAFDLCKEAGIDFIIPEDKEKAVEYWRKEIPGLILEAAVKLEKTFNAIVVDEGQDFMPEWWDALHCLNDGGTAGKFYVFYDPAQNIFSGNSFRSPINLPPVRLPHNCRNTRSIAAHCGQIIDCQIEMPSFAPTGEPCQIIEAADESAAAIQLGKILDAWLHSGLKLSQIAVLSPHRRADTVLKGKQKIGKCKISGDLSRWRAGETALFETIRSFKGLEADAIVLFALPPTDEKSHFTRSDYYVAASRAKHLLQIIELKK